MILRRPPVFVLSVLVAATLAPAARALVPEAPPSLPASYRIVPEDLLEITVVNQPDLSRSVPVLPDGKIAYPYLGEITVAGLTLRELTRRIEKGLEAQYVNPQVTILVRQRKIEVREVSVLGAVKTQGKHAIKEGWRVLDVIADSGGLSTERPEWVSATLYRSGGAESIPLDMVRLLATAAPEANPILEAGDILLVQELDPARTQIQVLGEVGRTGLVTAPRDGSVASVLAAAGGPTPKAALSRAVLLRDGATTPVDLRGLLVDGKLEPEVKLLPGDTLVIPQNKREYGVLGAVRTTGMSDYPDDQALTVRSVLTRAGGPAPGADLKGATVIRPATGGAGNPTLIPVDLEALLKGKGDASQDVAVQPGDILFVPDKQQRRGFRLTDALSFLPYVTYISLLRR